MSIEEIVKNEIPKTLVHHDALVQMFMIIINHGQVTDSNEIVAYMRRVMKSLNRTYEELNKEIQIAVEQGHSVTRILKYIADIYCKS